MFDELIAQGNSMIRRLEAYERVTVKEVEVWRATVEGRIAGALGADALARYNVIWDLFRDEIRRSQGSELTRSISALRRIVTLLDEFEERAKAGEAEG